ncbi:MAG: NAD-dependent epimerase/dehydratase family protein [Bacteroidota bacterium]
MKKKNIAIIGSNGFIGKHLTEKLTDDGDNAVFLFGKNDASAFGSSLPYRKLDANDKEQLITDFSHIDFIYYLASETIPSTSWENPAMDIEKNLLPFITFVEGIAHLNIKKIIFISSGGTVYGATEKMADEHSFTNPFSPYGIVKLTMEHFLNYFHVKYGLNFDIYRVSNVYGEGQNTGKGIGMINTFIEKIISEKKIYIFGDGKNVRNYLYVKDLAELMTTSLHTSTAISEIYNLSSDFTLNINDIVAIMKKIIPDPFEVVYKEARQSDNSTIHLNNSKIIAANPEFNFTGIEEGILKTYHHIKGLRSRA